LRKCDKYVVSILDVLTACPLHLFDCHLAALSRGASPSAAPVGPLRGATFEYRQDLPSAIEERAKMVASLQANEKSAAAEKSVKNASAAAAASGGANSGGSGGGGAGANASGKEVGQKTPVVLVVFIGGCTYGEISAIRQLARKEKNRREFVIATTKIVNGRTLLDGCVELIENNLDRASLSVTSGLGK
jgi:hypothetical protein